MAVCSLHSGANGTEVTRAESKKIGQCIDLDEDTTTTRGQGRQIFCESKQNFANFFLKIWEPFAVVSCLSKHVGVHRSVTEIHRFCALFS